MALQTAGEHTTRIEGGEKGSWKVRHRGSPADHAVLEQIFTKQSYAMSRLIRHAELRALYDALPRPLIIDAGANIGASALWFSVEFPRAHILAIEPDAGNFGFLKTNLAGYDVDARHAAVGPRNGRARLEDPGRGPWAFRALPDADGGIQVLSLSGLLAEKRAAGYDPFIVKIDIEGGESQLFSESTDWIDEVPILILELHDWLLPGQGLARPFLKCIADRDRDFVCFDENIFSIRNG